MCQSHGSVVCFDHESLPEDVRPINYRLWLKPDMVTKECSGGVEISLDVREATDTVVLNAAEMEIESVHFRQHGRNFGPATWALDGKTERLTLKLENVLEAGVKTEVDIRFKSFLNERMIGFYLSKFKRPDGTDVVMCSTQFEAHHARRCFPCWDQPDCKATFDVRLMVPQSLVALSNSVIERVSEFPNGFKTVIFETTPKMSTYLLAFVVGELECISDVTDDGVELRIWTTPGKSEQGRFALECTKEVLKRYDAYFGVRYGANFKKLDQVAIPDFSFGAMENWGLITYREIALLITAASSEAVRQYTFGTVAHELAHQWFGNLVTMKWWDNLWLNESFATWMANKVTNEIHPEWNTWTAFVADDMVAAMGLDVRQTTHAIEVPVKTAADIDEIFDAISYNKGGCVLRMLENYVGAEDFRGGLRLYMKRHQYQNTASADLWNAIGEAAGNREIPEIMQAWTSLEGFPLVQESLVNGDIVLKQTRCRKDGKVDENQPTWPIPLRHYRPEIGKASPQAWLFDEEQATLRSPKGSANVIMFNVDRTAFCRVIYDEAIMGQLLRAMADGKLSPEERFALADDAFALAGHYGQNITTFLDICASSKAETDYNVWSGLIDGLNVVKGMIAWDNKAARKMLRSFILELIADIVAKVGLERRDGESSDETMLRGMLLNTAVANNDKAVVAQLQDMFLSGTENIEPNIRPAVYAAVTMYGGQDGYESILARFRKETDVEEKLRFLRALGKTPDMALKARTLELCFSDEVRLQDAYSGVMNVATSVAGKQLVWEFVKANWKLICERHKGNNAKIGYYLKLAENLATPEGLADAEAFLAANPVDGLAMTAKQAIEKIQMNIRWRELNSVAATSWLNQNVDESGVTY